MAYEKTVWVNGQAPALDAEHLNKMEEGISIGASDPMGPWIYCGKGTAAGKENKLSFNVENLGKTVSEITNQICLCVNNCDIKYVKTGEVLFVAFCAGVTYKDGTEVDSFKLFENIYWGVLNQESLSVSDKIKNEKFLWSKLVRQPNILSSGDERAATYYLKFNSNAQVAPTEFNYYTKKEVKSIDFWLTNGNCEISNVDFEVYIR